MGVGTWLYGHIFDVTGNYDLAVVVAMVTVSASALSLWIASPRKIRLVVGRVGKETQDQDYRKG